MKTYDCVTIVGVGLIGGSVGLALLERGRARCVVGTGSSPASLKTALERHAITESVVDRESAVAAADIVVVCTPVAHIVETVRQLVPHCRPGTIITDAGSTKAKIVEQLARIAADDTRWPREVSFIGSHPLAGNEKRGPQFSQAELFAGRLVVLTPAPATPRPVIERLGEFWSGLGALTLEMPADEHDRALASTSHLPHLAAAAIAASTPAAYLSLTASGWLDTTRIAAGDPQLWQQILLTNRAHVLTALDRLVDRLTSWRQALEQDNATEVERLLSEAKGVRDAAGS